MYRSLGGPQGRSGRVRKFKHRVYNSCMFQGPGAICRESKVQRSLSTNTAILIYTYSLHGAESLLEANWFATSEEIYRISRNPKVHYRTHKRPPLASILGQPNPVHIQTSHLLEIHPNIIHLSRPESPQWSPSLRFPHQD